MNKDKEVIQESRELTMSHSGVILFNEAVKTFTKINGVAYHNLLIIDSNREDRQITVGAILPEDFISMVFDVRIAQDNNPLYQWRISNGNSKLIADSGRLVYPPTTIDNGPANAMEDFNEVLRSSDGYGDSLSLESMKDMSPWVVKPASSIYYRTTMINGRPLDCMSNNGSEL